MIPLNGKGAVYVRISEDDQDTTRQRKSTSEWIVRNGGAPTTATVYEDVGWKRHQADRRPQFQRMLRDADDGKVRWIVCDALDRFGTKNKNQLLAYLYRLQEAGCKLYTVNDKEWTGTDLLTLIEAGMEGEKSEKELRDKSERVIEAMRVMAEEGTWLGGRIPYGCDAVAFHKGKNGKLSEQWRVRIVGKQSRLKIDVKGAEKLYDGKDNFPATEQDEILQLRPSQDEARLEVVRNIFHRFDTETLNPNQLAMQLQSQSVPPPAYSKGWKNFHVREMLTNPVYIGKPGWNRRTHGHYTQWKGGKRHTKKPGPGSKSLHAVEDWIMPKEPIFPPIVDPALFERVRAKVLALPVSTRSPKSANMWLSGLIYCANCGGKMVGKKDTRTGRSLYICGTYVNTRGPRKACGCMCNTVEHERVEAELKEFLAKMGIRLMEVIGEMKQALSGQPEPLKRALAEAVAAHKRMREVVGAKFVQVDGGPVMLSLPAWEIGGGVFKLVGHADTDELEQLYRWKYDDSQAGLEHRLDELQGEQDKLFERLDKIPATSTSALARVQAELDQVDAEVRQINEKLENAADAFRKANDEYGRLNREWNEAQEAVESEVSARRKADAVRKVIARINLTFRPTGRKRPVSELLAVDCVPAGGPQVSQQPQPSPHRLGSQSVSSCQQSGSPSP